MYIHYICVFFVAVVSLSEITHSYRAPLPAANTHETHAEYLARLT